MHSELRTNNSRTQYACGVLLTIYNVLVLAVAMLHQRTLPSLQEITLLST